MGEAHLHHLAHVGPPPPEVGGGGRQDPSPVPVGVAHRHTLPVPHLVQVQGDPLLQGEAEGGPAALREGRPALLPGRGGVDVEAEAPAQEVRGPHPFP